MRFTVRIVEILLRNTGRSQFILLNRFSWYVTMAMLRSVEILTIKQFRQKQPQLPVIRAKSSYNCISNINFNSFWLIWLKIRLNLWIPIRLLEKLKLFEDLQIFYKFFLFKLHLFDLFKMSVLVRWLIRWTIILRADKTSFSEKSS